MFSALYKPFLIILSKKNLLCHGSFNNVFHQQHAACLPATPGLTMTHPRPAEVDIHDAQAPQPGQDVSAGHHHVSSTTLASFDLIFCVLDQGVRRALCTIRRGCDKP